MSWTGGRVGDDHLTKVRLHLEDPMDPADFPKKCPNCGLILLSAAIFDAIAMKAEYGPIIGLHKEVNKETATAGYVGISSLWMHDNAPELYRCPRCQAD